ADGLAATPTWGALLAQGRLGLWRHDVVSAESGLDPDGATRDTAFGLRVLNYGTTEGDAGLRTGWSDGHGGEDLADQLRRDGGGFDVVVVLANADRGGTSDGTAILLPAKAGVAGDPVGLLGHELGHAVADLADEVGGGGH